MRAVLTGLERWMEGDIAECALPAGSRIGLLAHPPSIDARGRHAVELLAESRKLRLERLFAPEHGLWGRAQDMEHIAEETDPVTGLPVVSLYGSSAQTLRPTAEQLAGLDAIVCDLQDVGSRYYTFIYTLSFVMEAARECGVPVIVLDRPNPIGGDRVEGPVLRPGFESFVGRYPLPVRHGMTIGELAWFFNDRFDIGCDLRVVAMQGWKRRMHFEDTRQPWVPPSPNMPNPTTAHVYPGGCLIEGTNISEGRGTTTPFELVGAPWLNGPRLAASLRERNLPGVVFRPASFRPMFQKHAGANCGGVQVIPVDRDAFLPFECYLVVLEEIRNQSPEQFGWRTETYEFESDRLAIDLLLGRSDLRGAIETGLGPEPLDRMWKSDLDTFLAARERYRIYS